MTDFLTFELWSYQDYSLRVFNLLMAFVVLVGWGILYRWGNRKLLRRFYKSDFANEAERKIAGRYMLRIFVLLGLITLVVALNLNIQLYPILTTDGLSGQNRLYINTVLQGLVILQLALLADWGISKILIQNYKQQRSHPIQNLSNAKLATTRDEKRAGRMVQSIAYSFALFFLVNLFQLDEIFSISFSRGEVNINITLSNVILAVGAILVARLAAWSVVQIFLHNYYKANDINIGAQYAINQLIRYIIYVFAIFIAAQNLGLQLTVVWGSIAALLVGVGLGLQQTFNDWISGFILLLERTVEVGHIIQIDDMIGTVRKIGLRVSRVQTLDNISILIPNSKLVTDKVINWSDFDNYARFTVSVGVAYGSDTALVEQLLLQAATETDGVLKYPKPFVRFTDFGDSALLFEVLFWSRNFIHIEDIKSKLRFKIDGHFRANKVQIPFPQMDVWLK